VIILVGEGTDIISCVPIKASFIHLDSGEPQMKHTASAAWSGGIKDGIGSISVQSGVLREAPYGFKARFEDGPGTNPEELIGAAHAGCFTMALSGELGRAGLTAESLKTTATVTLDKVPGGFSITAIHLDLIGKVPGADQAKFEEIANGAKVGCPVSKLFSGNAEITLAVKLEG
jgi:osmotically inducible protein OsmC